MNVGLIGLGQMGAGMAQEPPAGRARRDGLQPDGGQGRGRSSRRAHAPGHSASADAGGATVRSCSRCSRARIPRSESVTVRRRTASCGTLAPGAIHVSSSTISVALSERLAEAMPAGRRYVAAPVFGRPTRRRRASYSWSRPGKAEAVKLRGRVRCGRAEDLRRFRAPELANLVKLSGNFLIASVIESLGEAMALVGKGGVDRHQYSRY